MAWICRHRDEVSLDLEDLGEAIDAKSGVESVMV